LCFCSEFSTKIKVKTCVFVNTLTGNTTTLLTVPDVTRLSIILTLCQFYTFLSVPVISLKACVEIIWGLLFKKMSSIPVMKIPIPVNDECFIVAINMFCLCQYHSIFLIIFVIVSFKNYKTLLISSKCKVVDKKDELSRGQWTNWNIQLFHVIND
jgi:hypothetical protein